MPGLYTRMPFLLDSRIPINLYGLPLESGGVDPTSKTSQGLMQQLLAAQGLGPMDSWTRKHSLRTWYIYVHIYVYLFVWGMRRCVCITWGICGTPYIVYIEIPNAFFSAQRIAPLLPFQVVYLSKVCVYTKPISSRHIISNWQFARSAPESCRMLTVDESGHRPSRTETYWCAFVACMIYILYRFNFVDVIENRMIFSVHHLLRVFFMRFFFTV